MLTDSKNISRNIFVNIPFADVNKNSLIYGGGGKSLFISKIRALVRKYKYKGKLIPEFSGVGFFVFKVVK